MTESQAWEKFEEAMRDVQSFDEAIAWLNKNPEIREGLTVFEMMRNFNRDIRDANKYNRNLAVAHFVLTVFGVAG